jgi:hypothetical protein
MRNTMFGAMAVTVSAVVGGLRLGTSSLPAFAAPEKLATLHVHCTTAGTGADGSGKHCEENGCQAAPEGYVIIRDSYQVRDNSNNGGGIDAVQFTDLVEIIPGTAITGPRRVCIRVHANSQAGVFNAGARGWIDVTGDGSVSRYKQ